MITNNDVAKSLHELISTYLGINVEQQGVTVKVKQQLNKKELQFRTDTAQTVHKSYNRHR